MLAKMGPRRSKSKAIREYCLVCSGDSHKEVTLCHLFDCPLWPHRTGFHISSKIYTRRIQTAMKNYAREIHELSEMGVDIGNFVAGCCLSSFSGKDHVPPAPRQDPRKDKDGPTNVPFAPGN